MSSPTVDCCTPCVLAHDFINKLSIIIGQTELLSEHVVQEDCAARLKVIHDVAQAIASELKRHYQVPEIPSLIHSRSVI